MPLTLSVRPLEIEIQQRAPEQLAAAHAGSGGEAPRRGQAIAANLVSESPEFAVGPRFDAACGGPARRSALAAGLRVSSSQRTASRSARCRPACVSRRVAIERPGMLHLRVEAVEVGAGEPAEGKAAISERADSGSKLARRWRGCSVGPSLRCAGSHSVRMNARERLLRRLDVDPVAQPGRSTFARWRCASFWVRKPPLDACRRFPVVGSAGRSSRPSRWSSRACGLMPLIVCHRRRVDPLRAGGLAELAAARVEPSAGVPLRSAEDVRAHGRRRSVAGPGPDNSEGSPDAYAADPQWGRSHFRPARRKSFRSSGKHSRNRRIDLAPAVWRDVAETIGEAIDHMRAGRSRNDADLEDRPKNRGRVAAWVPRGRLSSAIESNLDQSRCIRCQVGLRS